MASAPDNDATSSASVIVAVPTNATEPEAETISAASWIVDAAVIASAAVYGSQNYSGLFTSARTDCRDNAVLRQRSGWIIGDCKGSGVDDFKNKVPTQSRRRPIRNRQTCDRMSEREENTGAKGIVDC